MGSAKNKRCESSILGREWTVTRRTHKPHVNVIDGNLVYFLHASGTASGAKVRRDCILL